MFPTGSLPSPSRNSLKSALQHRQSVPLFLILVSATTLFGTAVFERAGAAMKRPQVNQTAVTVVSAASFEIAPVAPEAIVAAFGTALATRVEIATVVPLPTSLAGTTVRVKDNAGVERLAPLFFVSPGQINCQIPANTAAGVATVTVTSGGGTVSTGTVQIAAVVPSLFTANASGQGVATGFALRFRADGSQEAIPILRFDQIQNRSVTVPIDLGPESDQVFLVLFGTGVRGNSDLSRVTARVGGVAAEVLFAGPQGDFIGLDQINLRLPRSLAGRGRVNLAVAVTGFSTSNLAEIEIGLPKGSSPPTVASFGPAPALAGQPVMINGSGFSGNLPEMLVRIAGNECRIASSTATQLSCQVPFGAQTGPVSVRTLQGEVTTANSLAVRTSISGIVETADRQPLSGVKVSLANSTSGPITALTNNEGAFLLPDASEGLGIVEMDGGAVSATLPFPKVQFKLRVTKDRDNQIERPVSLQQATGPTVTVGGSALIEDAAVSVSVTSEALEPSDTIQAGNVTFEIAAGTTVRFPDGRTSGTLTLTQVGNSRTPVNLPSGIYSPVIVQISPFGARLSPGGKLTFPNSDGFPAYSQVRLFRLDQTPNSPTLGSFIDAGTATVSVDGQRVETATDAVKETSYYFVANVQPTTTVAGRVVDADGKTPVRLAVVRVRGQETFTDGNGGFVLRNVSVKPANDQLSVEASFARPSGRVDRVQRDGIAVVVNGITTVTPDLVLPAEASNRPPVIVPPPTTVAINAGQTLNFNYTAYDPDPGQTIRVEVSGAPPWISIIKGSGDSYTLRLAPPAGISGTYSFTLKATDNQGAVSPSVNISVRVNPTVLSCGQTVSGIINSTVQRDTYVFSGKANDVVIITAKGTSGFVCAVTELYSPTGALIKQVDCDSTTGKLPLPSDGTYTISVYESGFNNTGGYTLNLQFADGRCGTAVSCGQTINKSVASIVQHDLYTFSGKTNDVVIITAKGTSGFVCAVTELYSPTGALVKRVNCDNTTGRVSLPSDGVYTILVYESGFDNTGGYTLNLQFADGRCGTVVSCGQIINKSVGSIVQYDLYTFSGKTNDVVIITGKGTSGFVCAVTELYSPTGTLIKQVNCDNTTGRVTLPADGTYTILVYESGFDNTGGYTLNLQFADGRCGVPFGYGQTKPGTIASIVQHDVYTFSGKTNDAVIATAKGTSGFVCAAAELYSPAGVLLGKNSCDDSTPRLSLPSDGTYTILVHEFGFDNVGNYNINLTCIGPTCNSALTRVQPLSRPSPNSTNADYTAHGNDANARHPRKKKR